MTAYTVNAGFQEKKSQNKRDGVVENRKVVDH